MTSRLTLVALAGVLMLSMLGCSSGGGGGLLEQPDPVKRYYVLAAQRQGGSCGTSDKGVLSVRRTNVAPSYASRELVYRVGPEAYTKDYYNLLLVQPNDQLTETLTSWLTASGLFRHVTPAQSALRPDYILESSILKLYGDFSAQGSAKAVLEAQFFLLKDDMAQYNVLFCHDYSEEVTFGDRSPEGLIKAMNQGLSAIFQRLEADMAEALARDAS